MQCMGKYIMPNVGNRWIYLRLKLLWYLRYFQGSGALYSTMRLDMGITCRVITPISLCPMDKSPALPSHKLTKYVCHGLTIQLLLCSVNVEYLSSTLLWHLLRYTLQCIVIKVKLVV